MARKRTNNADVKPRENPVLFYFWAHSEPHEFTTPVLTDLVRRADIILQEFNSPPGQLNVTEEIERDFNAYSQRGEMSPRFRMLISSPTAVIERFLTGITRGTNKRYMFEMSEEADFDLNKDDERLDAMFLEGRVPLERVLSDVRSFLEYSERYHTQREERVAEQIIGLPETTLVIFGSGHPNIENLVKSYGRPTEKHFPYPDYPVGNDTKMRMAFRQTGEVDKALFLRRNMEQLALKALRTNYGDALSNREIDLLTDYYATFFTPEQIVDYRDYLTGCKSLVLKSTLVLPGLMIWTPHSLDSQPQRVNAGSGDIFESYLSRNGLPPVKELVTRLRGEKREQPSQPAE